MVSGDSYLVRFIWFPLWELLCFNRIYCVLKGKYKIYMFPIIILAELGEGCELSSFIQKYAGISGLKQENSGEISRSNWWMLVERDEIRTLKSLPSSAWRFPPFLLFNNIWDDIPMTRIVSGVETCWNHQPDLEKLSTGHCSQTCWSQLGSPDIGWLWFRLRSSLMYTDWIRSKRASTGGEKRPVRPCKKKACHGLSQHSLPRNLMIYHYHPTFLR